ncbi:hypothetical protein MRX96_013932 [Rhipicephalus microplus]
MKENCWRDEDTASLQLHSRYFSAFSQDPPTVAHPALATEGFTLVTVTLQLRPAHLAQWWWPGAIFRFLSEIGSPNAKNDEDRVPITKITRPENCRDRRYGTVRFEEARTALHGRRVVGGKDSAAPKDDVEWTSPRERSAPKLRKQRKEEGATPRR